MNKCNKVNTTHIKTVSITPYYVILSMLLMVDDIGHYYINMFPKKLENNNLKDYTFHSENGQLRAS